MRPTSTTASGMFRSLALSMAVLLSACSGSDADTPQAAVAQNGKPSPKQGNSGDAPAKLKCPARTRKDIPGPDVIGLKLGMTYEEALGTARCALGEDAVVKTEQRWLRDLNAYGVELGTQSFTVKKGENRPCNYAKEWQKCEGSLLWAQVDEIVTVATPGAPGSETAMVVWRTQNFREGQMPAAQAVLDALIAKYGEPQYTENSDKPWSGTAGSRELRWVRDRRGTPLADPNPLFRQCWNAIGGRGENTSVNWRDGCGLNIWARVYLSGKNPGLAMELNMGMVQQSDLWAHAEATQAKLQQLGQARRDAEMQKAGDADVKL